MSRIEPIVLAVALVNQWHSPCIGNQHLVSQAGNQSARPSRMWANLNDDQGSRVQRPFNSAEQIQRGFIAKVSKQGFGRVESRAYHCSQSVQRTSVSREVILMAVRRYLRYTLAYEHVSELLTEWGLPMDASCIWPLHRHPHQFGI